MAYILKSAIQVFIRSEGCDDSGKYGQCGRAYIKVNGVDKSPHGRGYNLVVINEKTGQVESTKSFDTHGSQYAASSMLNFVNGLSDGKIVLIAIQDEGAMRMTAEGAKALVALGGHEPIQREYRGSYVLVGHKGSHSHHWILQKRISRRKGPAEVSVVIPLQ